MHHAAKRWASVPYWQWHVPHQLSCSRAQLLPAACTAAGCSKRTTLLQHCRWVTTEWASVNSATLGSHLRAQCHFSCMPCTQCSVPSHLVSLMRRTDMHNVQQHRTSTPTQRSESCNRLTDKKHTCCCGCKGAGALPHGSALPNSYAHG